MSDRDLYRTIAEELHGTTFGPDTDLHASFAVDDVDRALRFSHAGGLGQRRDPLLQAYGVEACSVPELIGQIAAFDEYSLLTVCSDETRIQAAGALRTRVADFLKALPDRYPELCPPEYLESHREGTYAVVLLMEGNGQGNPVYRSLRVENDTPELLGGRPVKTQHPDGPAQRWSIAMVVTRGMSLERAREFEAQYGAAVKSGEPTVLEEIRLARNASSLARESSGEIREPT